MNINDITKITDRVEIIDGEEVHILDKSVRENISGLSETIGCKKDSLMFSLLISDIEFIRNHKDFDIIFSPLDTSNKQWLPNLIYKFEGKWRRVQLENVKCLKCDWRGIGANPSFYDLFFTLENQYVIMDEMSKLPSCKCPKCGNDISRHAIWIEDSSLI